MANPAESRPSPRFLLGVAVLTLTTLFGVAACSSSDSDSADTDSSSSTDASESAASDDAADNDVATASEVSLTLEFDKESLSTIAGTGGHVAIAREFGASGGEVKQLEWLSLQPLESNTVTFDPDSHEVFATTSQLDPGAVVTEAAEADAQEGDRVTYHDNGTFSVTPGTAGTIEVENESTRRTSFGLAGTATVNGTDMSGPYGATTGEPGTALEFSDTGKIMVWVSEEQSGAGTVLGSTPAAAMTIDTATTPTVRLTWNADSGAFEQQP